MTIPVGTPGTDPAFRLAEHIDAGDLSSRDAVDACLDRIREREPVVRAWAYLEPELARAQAEERDRLPRRSRLHGVPFGVKDIIDTADMPTCYGSSIYAGHRPSEDAACVSRLRAAGAIILGKTVTTEFATWNPAETRNPHDPTRTPGGSSSGSAAAVADGMVPLALGSQTVGSAIRPASFCGVFCLKPTFGLIDLAGVKQLSAQFDTLALFARDVRDLELAFDVFVDATKLQPEPPRPIRLGLFRTPWWDHADRGGQRAVEEAARLVEHAAEVVEEVDADEDFAGLVEAHTILADCDIARSLTFEYESSPEALSESLRAMIERGTAIDGDTYRRAQELGERCRYALPGLFRNFDALLTPAVVGEAPAGLSSTGDALFCRPWMMLGTPALTVPGLTGENGLPIAVQLIGERNDDRKLLRVGEQVAEALAGALS